MTPLAALDQQIHDRELATSCLGLLRQLLGYVQAGKTHGQLQDILRREIREMENLQRTGERMPGTLAVSK